MMLPDSRSLHHIMRRKKKSRGRIININRLSILGTQKYPNLKGEGKKSPRGFRYPPLKVPTLVHMYNWFETLLLNDFKTYSQL